MTRPRVTWHGRPGLVEARERHGDRWVLVLTLAEVGTDGPAWYAPEDETTPDPAVSGEMTGGDRP